MARITIEDCMEQVPNRFHLVRMASIRAKQLKKGARPLLVSEENKEVVMSLREIAAGLVKPGDSAPPADALADAELTAAAEAAEAAAQAATQAAAASEAPAVEVEASPEASVDPEPVS
jgi:DNA-directed RNA polymerase subunit omega